MSTKIARAESAGVETAVTDYEPVSVGPEIVRVESEAAAAALPPPQVDEPEGGERYLTLSAGQETNGLVHVNSDLYKRVAVYTDPTRRWSPVAPTARANQPTADESGLDPAVAERKEVADDDRDEFDAAAKLRRAARGRGARRPPGAG